MVSALDLCWGQKVAYRDRKACRHSVEIVGMLSHGHHFGNDRLACPLHTKYFCELFQVLRGSFSDRENSVSQPSHAQITELLIEKFDTQLAREEGNIFDNSQTNSPLLVFGQLHNGGE